MTLGAECGVKYKSNQTSRDPYKFPRNVKECKSYRKILPPIGLEPETSGSVHIREFPTWEATAGSFIARNTSLLNLEHYKTSVFHPYKLCSNTKRCIFLLEIFTPVRNRTRCPTTKPTTVPKNRFPGTFIWGWIYTSQGSVHSTITNLLMKSSFMMTFWPF